MPTQIGDNQYVGNMDAFSCGDEGYEYGSVPVATGVNQVGETVYSCQGLSGLFGGGLYDTWLGQYLEDLDDQDIDRIFRQQEADAFGELLDGLDNGTKTWRDLQEFELDFLSEIPEMVEYYDRLLAGTQYDSLYNDIRNANGDPERLAEIFAEYENAGIETNPLIQSGLASTGSATSVITGTVDNSILEDMIRKAAIGDGILGGEVDFEDLPGYGGIWEGLIRHIKVIGAGLPLPIPDWLPLPGIFELPTIGEIFDTVTGPWKTAAEDALRDCVDTGKSASQCLEEQSVIDILVEGIGNATEGIWEATGGKVQEAFEEDGIVDRCTSNPSGCAQEVFDKLKDIFGEGVVDPTSTGGNIPDWMKVIIIGGTYGDEILGELEDLFGGDINDDGTIGVTDPNTFDCSSIGKSGGMVPDASYCGDCSDANQNDFGNGCEPVCQYNNAIPASSSECVEPFNDTGPTQQDCSALGRTHIPGDASTQTPSSCGGCSDNVNTVPEDENDSMSPCVAPENPNPTEGDPCSTGAPLNAQGTIGPAPDYECVPNEGADCTDANGNSGNIENGECVGGDDGTDDDLLDENGECKNGGVAPDCVQCPGYKTIPDWHVDGDCRKPYKDSGEPCGENGEVYDDAGNCVDPEVTGDCPNGNEPQYAANDLDQDGYYQFGGQWYQYDPCNANGGQTPVFRCSDGSFEENEGDCPADPVDCSEITDENYQECGKEKCEDGTFADVGQCSTGPQECAKPDGTLTGATPESGCEQCPQGFTFDFNGICQPDSGFSCDDYNKTTNEDGTCGPCKEGYQIDTSLPNEPCVKIFDGCSPGFELVNGQCTAIVCPEGQSYCIDTDGCVDIGTCPSDPPEEEGGDAGGGGGGAGGGGGGRSMFQPYSFAISADPQLLSRSEFPITDFLAGIFTNSRGGRNV